MKHLILLVAILLLAGCATQYQRVGLSGGYSEVQLAENVFKVTFRGNGYTSREKAADFALLRSAELALEHGFKYFAVIDDQNYANHSTYVTPTTTNASAFASGNAAYGTSTTYGGQSFLISKPSSTNMIMCFPEKPEGFSFNAEFVAKSLRETYKVSQDITQN